MTTSTIQTPPRTYGLCLQVPDPRDLLFSPQQPPASLPAALCLSPMPFVYDQKNLGSCTANAIGVAVAHLQNKLRWTPFVPSRLFLYYNERAAEGTTDQDAGGSLRDGLKALAKFGVCTEPRWPYDVEAFQGLPNPNAYADALLHRATRYAAVTQSETALKTALFSGHPVIFGISAYPGLESAETARTGIVPFPGTYEESIGGHAILLVGYNDATRRFKFQNSWGSTWGDHGSGYLSYDYVLSPALASDFWVIENLGNHDGVQDG